MSVLKRPILTEKATALSNLGKYVFEVAMTANKIEIAKAIEKMYSVSVASVDTMRVIGRQKTRMSRGKAISGSTSTYKKAIVTLKEGEVLDIYADIV